MADSWPDDDASPATGIPPREILSITQLNATARSLLERGLGSVWLEGEISNLARPASGHWYFSLKDEAAQVRCAMFRNRSLLVRFPVKDGARVLARGRVSLYEARGEFQVVIEHLEEAGEGALRRRFEELKRRLLAEGLFDAGRKQPLPTLPRRIGIITSPTGAALRDILHILQRRFPAVPALIYPVSVQGEAAPREIVQALQLADARRDCDVLIVARGGGSLEDLMAFNDEAVARAIAACTIPVISGVGHETDSTIADFVADERAPTPSGAAERAVPDSAEILRDARRTRAQPGAVDAAQAADAAPGAAAGTSARCSSCRRARACSSTRKGWTNSSSACSAAFAIAWSGLGCAWPVPRPCSRAAVRRGGWRRCSSGCRSRAGACRARCSVACSRPASASSARRARCTRSVRWPRSSAAMPSSPTRTRA